MNCWSEAGFVGAAVWKMGSCKYFIPKRSRIALGRLGRPAYASSPVHVFKPQVDFFDFDAVRTVRRAKVPAHKCPSTTILEPSALTPSSFNRFGSMRRTHS